MPHHIIYFTYNVYSYYIYIYLLYDMQCDATTILSVSHQQCHFNIICRVARVCVHACESVICICTIRVDMICTANIIILCIKYKCTILFIPLATVYMAYLFICPIKMARNNFFFLFFFSFCKK